MTSELRQALHEMTFYELVCVAKDTDCCDCERENCGCLQGVYCMKNDVHIHPIDVQNHLRWIKKTVK